MQHYESFKIGDLVMFDSHYSLGLVIEIKPAYGFNPEEKIKDVKVAWTRGGAFWCLDCTLVLLSRE